MASVTKPILLDETGKAIVTQLQSIATGGGLASTTTAGKVKPDGSTITIDPDGTIHGAPNVISSGTEDIGEGASLASGTLYVVLEEEGTT